MVAGLRRSNGRMKETRGIEVISTHSWFLHLNALVSILWDGGSKTVSSSFPITISICKMQIARALFRLHTVLQHVLHFAVMPLLKRILRGSSPFPIPIACGPHPSRPPPPPLLRPPRHPPSSPPFVPRPLRSRARACCGAAYPCLGRRSSGTRTTSSPLHGKVDPGASLVEVEVAVELKVARNRGGRGRCLLQRAGAEAWSRGAKVELHSWRTTSRRSSRCSRLSEPSSRPSLPTSRGGPRRVAEDAAPPSPRAGLPHSAAPHLLPCRLSSRPLELPPPRAAT
jgi:hypothetical protein